MSTLKKVFDELKAKFDQSEKEIHIKEFGYNGYYNKEEHSIYIKKFNSNLQQACIESFGFHEYNKICEYRPCSTRLYSDRTLICSEVSKYWDVKLHQDTISLAYSLYEENYNRSRSSHDSFNHTNVCVSRKFRISKMGDSFKVVEYTNKNYQNRYPTINSREEIVFDDLLALLDYFGPFFQFPKPDWVIKKLAEEKTETLALSVPKRQPT